MAMELKERGDIRAIFPVLVGELLSVEGIGDSIYGDFFRGGGAPACGSEVVQSVEANLVHHLDRLGKGAPRAYRVQPVAHVAVLLGEGALHRRARLLRL